MTINEDYKTELVELLESVSYLLFQDDNIQPEHFYKVGIFRTVVVRYIGMNGMGWIWVLGLSGKGSKHQIS